MGTRTTVPSTTETVYSDYALAVMELIDAGTCADLTVSTNCDTAVTGYFKTFEYNGNRVIISSGAPNHDAETDAYLGGTLSNRFLRCEELSLIRGQLPEAQQLWTMNLKD